MRLPNGLNASIIVAQQILTEKLISIEPTRGEALIVSEPGAALWQPEVLNLLVLLYAYCVVKVNGMLRFQKPVTVFASESYLFRLLIRGK